MTSLFLKNDFSLCYKIKNYIAMKRLDFEEPIEEFDEKEGLDANESLPQNNKYIAIGVILVIVGSLIAVNRLGILPDFAYHLFFNWKMLLIAIGVSMIFTKKSNKAGIILSIIGVTFLVPQVLHIPFGLRHLLFPTLIVVAGIFLILKHKGKLRDFDNFDFSNDTKGYSNDYLNETYIFGGGNLHVVSDNFKGGKISAIFGGGQIDLRDAILSNEKRPFLKIDMIFGGVEIIVPSDWNVIIKSNSIFGGFGSKRNGIHYAQIDKNKEIVIIANAIFGGGEIKRG